MKIAITSTSESIKNNISDVFGRCPYFIIAEIKNDKVIKSEAVKNTSIDQMSSAGVSAAQLLAENNVNIVITGNVGPRALDVLKQFNIEVYFAEGVAENALQQFIEGNLKKINPAK